MAWSRLASLALGALLTVCAGSARAGTPLRVLVLAGSERERELASRIRGQTADLDAVVTIERSPSTDIASQFAAARAAAARADVVVWFGDGRGGWVVYVARGERVLVRRIAGASGAMSESASLEAAALAVRTAVRGLAAGGEIDVEEPPAEIPPPALRPWAELGWAGVLDGGRATGHHGVTARLGGAWGRWSAGLGLGFHPAASLGRPGARFEAGRQQAALVLGAELLAIEPKPRWSLCLEFGLGATRFPRVTTEVGAGLSPTAARSSWSLVATPALRASRRLFSGTWLALGLGADLLAQPPEFGVSGSGGFERVAALGWAEPRLSLSLRYDSP